MTTVEQQTWQCPSCRCEYQFPYPVNLLECCVRNSLEYFTEVPAQYWPADKVEMVRRRYQEHGVQHWLKGGHGPG